MGWQDSFKPDPAAAPAAAPAGAPSASWRDSFTPDPTAVEIEPPNLVERVGRGMMDVAQGAKQKYLNWTDPQAAAQYTADVNKDIAYYDKGRENGGAAPGSIDAWRIAGAAVPMGALLPAGAVGLAARTALGAAGAGAGSYLTFNETNQDNGVRALAAAATGGVIGAAAPPLAAKVMQAFQGAKNRLTDLARLAGQSMVPDQKIISEIRVSLGQQGINFDKLGQDVQASLLADARAHLSVAPQLDAAQLARKADIETVAGAGSATRAQVSRSPADWTQERNLQKVEANIPAVQNGEAETLTGRLQAQGEAARKYADDVGGQALTSIQQVGPPPRHIAMAQPASSSLEAGSNAIKAIQARDKELERATKNLYDAYRAHGAENVSVPDVKVADAVGRVADEVGIENIPPAVLGRLKSFGFLDGERTKLLTVNEADKLNRLINNNNPGHGPGALALGRIKTALNESLQDIPQDGAAKALLDARAAHSARMAAAESSRGVSQALDDVAPDKFLDQNVLGGSVRDLTDLRSTLQQTPEGAVAWNQLRQKAWDTIIERATNRGLDPISGSALHKQLEGIGKDRLSVLFSPEEIQQIETLRRGTLAMTRAPAFSAVNNSNTSAGVVAQGLRLLSRIPGAGVVSSPMENAINASTQAANLRGALTSAAAPNTARLREQAAARAAFAASPTLRNLIGVGGVAAGQELGRLAP